MTMSLYDMRMAYVYSSCMNVTSYKFVTTQYYTYNSYTDYRFVSKRHVDL